MSSQEPNHRLILLTSTATLALTLYLGFPALANAAEREPDPALAVVQQAQVPPADATAEEEEEEEEIETIVVTGFRQSLTNAIANKRRADIIIESISDEDLGRLPDVSVAEALARLPGVASQRTDGQASAINIRGISQTLVFATLNGREQVTQNGNRSVEFDQYPSELLAGADVYKSPKASLIEGGLAGTVELKTLRPLDRNKRSFSINARGSFNDRADQILDANSLGYRVSGSYVDQFADDRIGVSVGYARLVQPDVSVRFVGFDYAGRSRDFNADGLTDNPSFGFETEQQGGRNIRDGVFGTFQVRPAKVFEWTTDFFYSRFQTDSVGRGVRVIGTQEVNGTNTVVTNPTVAGRALVGGNFRRNIGAPTLAGGGFGLTIQGINDDQEDRNNLFTVGSQAKFTFDRLTFSGDFTWSRAESRFANEVSAVLPIVAQNAPVTSGNGNFPTAPVLGTNTSVQILLRGVDLPQIAFGQDLTDRNLYRLARFGVFPFENEERLFAYRGDVNYRFDTFVKSVDFGVRYSTRDASQFRESADFGNDAGFFQFAETPLAPIQLTDANSSIQCFRGAFAAAGFPCFIAVFDPRALVEAQLGGPVVPDQDQGFTRNDTYTVSENVISGYVQANLDTSVFGGTRLTGNIGVRVVHTEQSSFNQEVQAVTGRGSVGRSYTQFLPSGNFNFQLGENDVLRLAASRAISRPPTGQLGGGVGVGFNVANNRLEGGGGGNAGLLPFLANQGDISYEHYFGKTGIFSFALFYKNIESFIFSEEDEAFNFETAGLLPLLNGTNLSLFTAAQAGPRPPGVIGRFNGPGNGQGGFVRGLEIAATGSATFLPGAWSGLGATVSYSYTDSQINFVATNSGEALQLPLPGLSNHVFNGTVFYERAGFSNRVGIRYRTNFISPQIGINQQLPFTNSELVIDYQASYKFPETSRLKGFTLLAQANNLTDEPVRTFFGSEAQTGTLQFFGRQFFFGASYTF